MNNSHYQKDNVIHSNRFGLTNNSASESDHPPQSPPKPSNSPQIELQDDCPRLIQQRCHELTAAVKEAYINGTAVIFAPPDLTYEIEHEVDEQGCLVVSRAVFTDIKFNFQIIDFYQGPKGPPKPPRPKGFTA